MTPDDFINGLLVREGGFVDNPADRGGPTNFGITATSWGFYMKLGRPATAPEIQAITRDRAVEFYRWWLAQTPFAVIGHEGLRQQLIDFGIVSGNERAIRWLQRVLGVPVTSTLDARTRAALFPVPTHLVNDALVAARLYMDHMIVDADRSQTPFMEGWQNRALAFFLSRPNA
jgi:lysozyme family protein